MAGIAAAVAVSAAVSPRRLLGLFGIPGAEVTGVAALGWRLFAMRTGYLAARSLSGDSAADRAFLPLQMLDQLVFWHAYRDRSVPRRAAVGAAAISAGIVWLDLERRGALSGRPRTAPALHRL